MLIQSLPIMIQRNLSECCYDRAGRCRLKSSMYTGPFWRGPANRAAVSCRAQASRAPHHTSTISTARRNYFSHTSIMQQWARDLSIEQPQSTRLHCSIISLVINIKYFKALLNNENDFNKISGAQSCYCGLSLLLWPPASHVKVGSI